MFQPSGPNFFLSSTMAWKKQRPKTIRLQLIPRPNAYTQTIDVMGVGLVTAGFQVHANEKEVEGANEGVEGKGIPPPSPCCMAYIYNI